MGINQGFENSRRNHHDKVNSKESLPVGTQVNNMADNYFDFNAPVVTDTTNNTISTAVGISPLSFKEELEVSIYPNPAKEKAQIISKGTNDYLNTNMYNPMGQVLQLFRIKGHHELDLSHLSNGVYYLSFSTPEGIVASKYLVIGR